MVLNEIDALRHKTRVIVVDFHAEATSEKIAMGWHLDGKVTLVVGTHTHVQTADERILPNGTAYLTDAGMTGPHDGIIGMEREPSLARFLNGMPSKFEPATANPRLNGVLVSADDKTGRAVSVTRLSYSEQDLAAIGHTVRAESASRVPTHEPLRSALRGTRRDTRRRRPPAARAAAANPDCLRAYGARPHAAGGTLLRNLG